MSLPTSPLNNPKVSIIMAAYNRADTLPRAINSVLCQDMPDWELIIVDDGSTDNTRAIIESYLSKDSRIRAAFHECNLHVNAAKNTGFDLMIGEWFTTLDSDDEMVPSALSTMLRLLETVDPAIDAITCNCLDSTTGKFSGHGLDHDQWIDFETLMTRCSGEHWGLTKRSLLGSRRFNSKMRGGAEAILWWEISKTAKRYYLNQALRIYHTDGANRLCGRRRTVNLEDRIGYYREMALETEHLELLRQYHPADYTLVQRNIALSLAMLGQRTKAWNAYREARPRLSLPQRTAVLMALLGGRQIARTIVKAALQTR
ncbi:MAG: glycosyltransferase family 2 protein [Victivallaceae bacterium]|jgi:glycosyltransferase involved in cell wall biosynthesis